MSSRKILDLLAEGMAGGPAELVPATVRDSYSLGIPSIRGKIENGDEVKICRGIFVDGIHTNLVVYPSYIGIFILGDSSASWRLHETDTHRSLSEIGSELGLRANVTIGYLKELGFDEFI